MIKYYEKKIKEIEVELINKDNSSFNIDYLKIELSNYKTMLVIAKGKKWLHSYWYV